ncbi:hypothetical protein CHS0354_032892 [Potamilus streckersoni]|uniref:Uncharacterized protein n=1 Tax=Potamilus streckersoni TaxID=2493646 RepID=A0AAE0RWB2_9BIVA|nr:hypothetical protein CHS0354_032892 [Potamilus streckersoni]
MNVIKLLSCPPKKFSVLHDDEVSFVHLTFSARVQRYIISCTNGFYRSRKGFKRNVDLLTKGANVCNHLMELKNLPQYWMEFSDRLPIDTPDDMQTEAIPDSIDVEINIENQFTTQEILPQEEQLNRTTLLLSLLCDSVQPVFKRFLAHMSEAENTVPDENIAFANIVNMLSTRAPVITLIPHAYLDCLIELLDHITGKKVNNGGDLFFNRKMHEYSPEIRDLIGTTMLGNINENGENCVRQDVVDFIRFLIKQVSDMNVTQAEPAMPQFASYNPQKFERAYYFSESGKKSRSVRKFSIDCERKITLAFDGPPLEHDQCEKYFLKLIFLQQELNFISLVLF